VKTARFWILPASEMYRRLEAESREISVTALFALQTNAPSSLTLRASARGFLRGGSS
jgi:hypothetical protein